MIVQRVLELDQQGLKPSLLTVRSLTDAILLAQGKEPVGHLWPHNFLGRQPMLRMRWSRRCDYQRAACEDPRLLDEWFRIAETFIAFHGISPQDTYNFDETGFQMGAIGSFKVITSSERTAKPRHIQPSNTEWVTNVQGNKSQGWYLPPFLIFKGKELNGQWLQCGLPGD